MASRTRILGATILVAAVVVAGVVLRVRGEEGATPFDGGSERPGAKAPPASGRADSADPPDRATSRRVDRAAFVDGSDAADAASVEEPPVPPHLRRVVVRLQYDDGHPLAATPALAERADSADGRVSSREDSPEAGDATAWAGHGGAVVWASTDAAGRSVFRVPRGAAFTLRGDGGVPYPPFRSGVVTATEDELVATVAARAARVVLVDEAGAAVGGVVLAASGAGPAGNGSARQTTDAAGRAVFRGFAGRVRIEIYGDFGEFAAAFVRTPAAGKEDEEEDGEADVYAATDAETRIVVRRLTAATMRVVDRNGAPVEGALAAFTVDYGDGVAANTENQRTGADGRVRTAVPTDDAVLAADVLPRSLRFAIWAPGSTTATVVERPAPRMGDPCDFGDVAVETAPLVKFRVVDARGAPVEVAYVEALTAPRAEVPWTGERVATDATGTAVLHEPRDGLGFSVSGGGVRVVVAATDEARRRDGPGQTVALPAGSTVRLVMTDPARAAGAGFEARALDGDPEGFACSGNFSDEVRALLFGAPAGARLTVALYGCNGAYAEFACVAPADGESVDVPVPAPPTSVVRLTVVDVDGVPITDFGASFYAPDDGRLLADIEPEPGRAELTTPCVGAFSGDVLVRATVGGTPTERRVALTPPLTQVVVRLAPQRTVRLVVREPRSAALDAAAIMVDEERNRDLNAVRIDARTTAFETYAPADEAVRFRVDYAGENFVIDVPAGKTEGELVLPATGTVRVVVGRRPVAAILWSEARPLADGATEVGSFDDFTPATRELLSSPLRVRAGRDEFTPATREWRSFPLRVRAGRCTVRAQLTFTVSPETQTIDCGTREVTVVAGKETVVEF